MGIQNRLVTKLNGRPVGGPIVAAKDMLRTVAVFVVVVVVVVTIFVPTVLLGYNVVFLCTRTVATICVFCSVAAGIKIAEFSSKVGAVFTRIAVVWTNTVFLYNPLVRIIRCSGVDAVWAWWMLVAELIVLWLSSKAPSEARPISSSQFFSGFHR